MNYSVVKQTRFLDNAYPAAISNVNIYSISAVLKWHSPSFDQTVAADSFDAWLTGATGRAAISIPDFFINMGLFTNL